MRARRANTSAMAIAPSDVSTHATSANFPYGASEEGSRKMPEPIMLPTTSATHAMRPSSRFEEGMTGSVMGYLLPHTGLAAIVVCLMALRVYDTLKQKKTDFEPVHPRKVGMYVCGMTVQDKPHMGHMLAFVSGDMIRRYLEHLGYEVAYIQNFT